jgi:hypothetical protein
MRYRLSTLLVAMAWVGLVCLALRSPSWLLSSVMFAILVLALLTAALLAIYRTGQSRALAVGFLIFTVGYLIVDRGYWPAGKPGMHVPTASLAAWLFTALHGDVNANFTPELHERSNSFSAICTTSVAVIVGVLGGIIAQALYRTRPTDRQS